MEKDTPRCEHTNHVVIATARFTDDDGNPYRALHMRCETCRNRHIEYHPIIYKRQLIELEKETD